MMKSISPNNGLAFADWSPICNRGAADRLEQLDSGTNDLTKSIELRRDVLRTVIETLDVLEEDLLALITAEVGKTPSEAQAELPYASSFAKVALELLDSYQFESEVKGHFISEVPRGTGLLIAPYNDPVAGLIRKIAPCIAAGSAALVKPSELGIQCALRLDQGFVNAGIQKYVSILPIAQHEITTSLIKSKEIGTVSFTGSTDVGLQLASIAGLSGKPFVGELGGTNPFVLMEDANLNLAIPDLVRRKVKAAGQACSAPNIVFAAKQILEEVETRLISELKDVTYGPASDLVDMGPLRTAEAIRKLEKIETELAKEGEICIFSPKEKNHDGFVYSPKLYRISHSDIFEMHEVFAPLMAVCAFDEITELRKRLKINRQPLVLYVYGENKRLIKKLISSLKYGSVGINTTAIQGPDIPTGGFDLAGVGRDGGFWGMSQFLTTINRKGGN